MSFACNGAAKKILMSVTLALGFGFACGACSCRPVATPSDGGFVPASLQIAPQSGFDDVYDSVVSCAKTDWSSFEGWWCDEENATSEFIDVRGMHQIEIFFSSMKRRSNSMCSMSAGILPIALRVASNL